MINNKKTKEEFKKEMLSMFFLSVDNELHLWQEIYDKDYYSPFYMFNLDSNRKSLFICRKDSNSFPIDHKLVNLYGFLFFITNFKIWRYAKKIKVHIELIKERQEISEYNDSLLEMKKRFIKGIRKNKLKNIIY